MDGAKNPRHRFHLTAKTWNADDTSVFDVLTPWKFGREHLMSADSAGPH